MVALIGISSPALLVISTIIPRFLTLITIAITVVCSNHASEMDSQASDRTALLSFKSCVWGNLSDWGSPKMCNWTGVTCNSRGRVIYLLLSNSDLSGVISPAIGNLSALMRLDLQSNKLSGGIPPELGMLSQLGELNLNINFLDGFIPEALGLLKSLTYFSMYGNNLTGSIPEAVCNCSSLAYIDLRTNSLTGEIPFSTRCQLPHLKKIVLFENRLVGSIPPSISNFTRLDWVLLQNNFLRGELPSQMFHRMTSLKYLYLSDNNFSSNDGNTNLEPFLASLMNCTTLQELGVDSNGIGGKIPPIIGNLSSTGLSKLYLNDNQINGTIPNTIGNLPWLTDLHLDNNMLEGPIPSAIFQPSGLTRLVLAYNQINGEIPKSIGLTQNLSIIHMSYNYLQGTIPETLSNLTKLDYLVLDHNQLSGVIPPGLGCSMILDLSYNKLTGQIPTGTAGFSSFQMYLNLSNNLLEATLPLEFGNMDKIQALDLSANKLSGAIPAQIKGCAELKYVNLSRNFLQDTLPSSIGALPSSLHVLDVSLNKLTGMIPLSLQASPVLQFANFSHNNFTGEVFSEGAFVNLTDGSFLGNPGLCGSILGMAPCSGKHGHFLYIVIIVIIVTIAVGLLAMVCVVEHDLIKTSFSLTAPSIQSSRSLTESVNVVGKKESEHPRISYRELVEATDGFSEVNLIGKGGYGHVYRGVLHGGAVIAVKVLHQDHAGEVITGSFERECRVLRSIRHRNLIRVITACSTPEFKAVVLPFMPNGSLDSLIHGPPGGGKPEGPRRLDLDLLLSIVSDVAEGMAYLHHHAPVKVVHCDLKPSNVLLDADMTAVVSDFGISKLVITAARDPEMGEASASVCNSITRLLQGSVGYIAPEYGLGGRPSTEGDVYSFGVMLLEMISGKRPTDVISEEGYGLHDWAKNRCLQHGVGAVAERSLLRDPPVVLPLGPPGCEMEAVVVVELLELGVACSQLAPSMRPTMDNVASEIACLRDVALRKYRATHLQDIDQTVPDSQSTKY